MSRQQHIIAGVDEAGRGPLVGCVIAAAVILNFQHPIQGLTDSKKLSPKKRDNLYDEIMDKALCVGIAKANVQEIDQYNILRASLLAMQRAVFALSIKPDCVRVDGQYRPILPANYRTEAVIKGDLKHEDISAASIIAKVTRDRLMKLLDRAYPAYGIAQHKGYGTKIHLEALAQCGLTPEHRLSFNHGKLYTPTRSQ